MKLSSVKHLGVAFAPILIVFVTACGGATQTSFMKEADMELTTRELRVRVNELAKQFVSQVEGSADAIRRTSTDPVVRRNALVWKARAIPAAYAAVFQPDPLAAMLDLWALTVQLRRYLTDGLGAENFGDEQQTALAALKEVESAIEQSVRDGNHRQDISRGQGIVWEWAAQHPLTDLSYSRGSIATLVAQYLKTDGSTFDAVGSMAQSVEDISTQLTFFVNHLPRQATWEAELMTDDMLDGADLQQIFARVNSMTQAAERALQVAAQLPELVERESAILTKAIEGDLVAALADVERQRLEAQAWMTEEGGAMEGLFDRERKKIFDRVGDERDAVMGQVQQASDEAVKSFSRELRSIVDYFIVRFFAGLAFFGAVLVVFVLYLVRRLRPAK